MAKAGQLSGSSESNEESGTKKVAVKARAEGGSSGSTNITLKAEEKVSLYERLGGEVGLSNIVVDFTPRVMNDPRVNWCRRGVTQGGFSFRRGESVTWDP